MIKIRRGDGIGDNHADINLNCTNRSQCDKRYTKYQAKRLYFNIVEVALALAIVGIGMATILALFPVGISASRNAIGNTLASQVAEEFMSFIKAKSEMSAANYDAILADIPGQIAVDEFKLELEKAQYLHEDETARFLKDFKLGDDSDYSMIAKWGNIFRNKHSDRKFIFILMQRVEDTDTDPDFTAAVLMWRTQLDYSNSGGGTGIDAINWQPPMTQIMALHIEVSWPLTKVYKDREKRYYYTIIKRP
jgi:hypothetical protein